MKSIKFHCVVTENRLLLRLRQMWDALEVRTKDLIIRGISCQGANWPIRAKHTAVCSKYGGHVLQPNTGSSVNSGATRTCHFWGYRDIDSPMNTDRSNFRPRESSFFLKVKKLAILWPALQPINLEKASKADLQAGTTGYMTGFRSLLCFSSERRD